MAKKKSKGDENLVAVEEALSRTEQFIENNQNKLIGVIAGIAILVLAVIGYKRYIKEPKERNAQSQMFKAQEYFEADSLSLALIGDGNYDGFEQILSSNKSTKAGNLAHFYTGISYLKQGQFNDAIDELKKFKSDDAMVSSMALGAIGDAHMELGDMDKAVEYYIDAANNEENILITPVFLKKAGMTYELLGDYEKAVDAYNKIKSEYTESLEFREIDKYIARASSKL